MARVRTVRWLAAVVAVAVALLARAAPAECVRFTVASAGRRCVLDELRKDQLATGEYVVEGRSRSAQVDISVTGPGGEEVFARSGASEGQFGFTAAREGDYEVCFHNREAAERMVSVKLRSGVEAKDLSEMVQQHHVKPLSAEVFRIQETIRTIRDELLSFKETEAQMRDLNESINTRVTLFSLFSVGVVSSLGVWQILYLKRYFAEKKLI